MSPSWSARSRRENNFDQQQQQQQQQQWQSEQQWQRHSKPKLWRKLQVQKSTALGLVIPWANLQLEVRHVDRADQDLGPAYRTSKLHWEECLVTMLPKFELLAVNNDTSAGIGMDRQKPIARVSRPLWNWARSTLAGMEMLEVDETLLFEHRLPSDVRKTWSLHQKGLGRHYNLLDSNGSKGSNSLNEDQATFTWKGSKHIISHLEDYNPLCHGNLKLLDEDGTMLAAWKQQRDTKVLGSIHVFEEARDRIPIEVIVVSCLCIAVVEKCTGVTWLGGL